MTAAARNAFVLAAALLGSVRPGAVEAASPIPERFLQGFVRKLSGESIVYPWSYAGEARTLLSRATDGTMAVEWEGEAPPPGSADEPVAYVWHAGLNSGRSGGHRFTLSVNGHDPVTFMTSPSSAEREWSVRGREGETLSFTTLRVSPFDERFGFMVLTASRGFFGDGAPRFRVVGEAAGSIDYYLGAQERVAAWTAVRPEEAVLAGGRRAVAVEVSHLGGPQPAAVRARGEVVWRGVVDLGYRRVEVAVDPRGAAEVPVSVAIGDRETFAGALKLAPVRAREVHLLPHSHVDIGYSDPQPEVERKQWKNLRDAVELGRKTASYPPRGALQVERRGALVGGELPEAGGAPRNAQAFLAAVRDGHDRPPGERHEHPHGPRHAGGAAALDRRLAPPARRVRPPARCARRCTPTSPASAGRRWPPSREAGVRYFSSGPNYMPGLPDGGDRIGGTLKALGDKPFWWASPSGEERLLFWMAGRGYSWFHGLNMGRMTDRSRDDVLAVREGARATPAIPCDMVQVRYTIGGDNGPVDPALPDAVKAWNEQFASPRLVINTADAMFAEFERKHGARAARDGRRHDAVLGGRRDLERGGGGAGARGGAAPRAGRDAVGAAPARGVPGRRRRRGLAQRDPLARAHVGRGRLASASPIAPTSSPSGSTSARSPLEADRRSHGAARRRGAARRAAPSRS